MLTTLGPSLTFCEMIKHLSVNHSVEFVNDQGVHTNNIEGLWKHVKKLFLSGSSNRKEMTQQYLDFFSFFAYSKNKKISTFDSFLKIIKNK